jgi:hypothetical protein
MYVLLKDPDVTSEERADTGSAESASIPCSRPGPHPEHQAPVATNMFISHEDSCSISTSSSSSAQPGSEYFGGQSVPNIDIVEVTDGAGDVSHLDAGAEPVITIIDDESPERIFSEESHVTVSEVLADIEIAVDATPASSFVDDGVTVSVTEVEVMEIDEIADMVVEGQDEYHGLTPDVPLHESSDSATEESVIKTQVCAFFSNAGILTTSEEYAI